MSYDLQKEKEDLIEFLGELADVFKRQQDIYKKDLALYRPLSAALVDLSNHAGTFVAIRLAQEASQTGRVDEEGQVSLVDEDLEFISEIHNKLIDFLVEEFIPSMDEDLIDVDPETEFSMLVDTTFNNAFDPNGQITNNFEHPSEEE